MKFVHVGLGDFGMGWLTDILMRFDGIQLAAVVDKQQKNLQSARKTCGLLAEQLFEDLEEALRVVKPDFLVNTTPPNVHKAVNLIAFKHGIPVLSEKPIAEDYSDVVDIVRASKEHHVPIMISENYRYYQIARELKKIISEGEIGQINSVYIDFFVNHSKENYHKDLKHPLLIDVAIHHLDLLRYLTDSEALEVYAKFWNPSWSAYQGFSTMNLFVDMENSIRAEYRGSLSSTAQATGWLAEWKIEGDRGTAEMRDGIISVKVGQTARQMMFKKEDSRNAVLAEFLTSLRKGCPGETDISDNIKTQQIAEAAIRSNDRNTPVKISEFEVL